MAVAENYGMISPQFNNFMVILEKLRKDSH